MPEILVRAGMLPGQEPDTLTCWQHDLFGGNSGNIVFAESVLRSIYHSDNSYTVGYPVPKNAAEINERYSAFVIPLANAFRKSFSAALRAYTHLIRQLTIPCIVVGVGAQTDLTHSLLAQSEIDDDVRDFVRAVLEKSHSIGVRGHFTAQYLEKLGFKDRINVIGCPSMYLHQGQLAIQRTASLPEQPRLSVNMTTYKPQNIGNWFRTMWRQHPSSQYIMQDRGDLSLLLWGKTNKAMPAGDATPAKLNHPYIRRNRAFLFHDVASWLDALRGQDFSVGTRIHGNVVALLAGTPALVIAHDSRTLEMAQFFHIPHVRGDQVDGNTSVADLYAQADFSALQQQLPSKFANYCQFLRDNGLQPHYGLESSLHQRPLHGSAAPITALTGLALEQRLDALHQHLLAS